MVSSPLLIQVKVHLRDHFVDDYYSLTNCSTGSKNRSSYLPMDLCWLSLHWVTIVLVDVLIQLHIHIQHHPYLHFPNHPLRLSKTKSNSQIRCNFVSQRLYIFTTICFLRMIDFVWINKGMTNATDGITVTTRIITFTIETGLKLEEIKIKDFWIFETRHSKSTNLILFVLLIH